MLACFSCECSGIAAAMSTSSTFQWEGRGWDGRRQQGLPSAPSQAFGSRACVSYESYYKQRWGIGSLDSRQPVLRGTPMRGSHLWRGGTHQLHEAVHLFPQLCTVHPIPAALWPALSAAREAVWQLESSLTASDLLRELCPGGEVAPGVPPPPLSLVRSALTARSALDGACGDYEVLETVGDAFMKYAVSIDLFTRHKHFHEVGMPPCWLG
jgi:dsRNA-specific ribonuclease